MRMLNSFYALLFVIGVTIVWIIVATWSLSPALLEQWTTTGSEVTTAGSAPYAVFLNLYFENGADAVQMANTISAAKEQFHQIGSAFAAMASNNHQTLTQPATLYYNTIGDRNLGGLNTTTSLNELCSQYYGGIMNCQHMEHFDKGYEEVTLNKLYDYCQESDDRASHRVAYLHNKGSHHPEGWWDNESNAQIRQDCWRRSGTAAAVSEMCLKPVDDSCNVCGLLWTPIPWQHSPGNFWSAKCSYVRKLLRPIHYQTLHDHLLTTTYEPMCDQGKMIAYLRFLMGAGRWAMEMWIGSHPSIKPCYLSSEPSIKHWQIADRNFTQELNFSMFPRPDHDMRTMVANSEPRYGEDMLNDESHRMRDFNLLGGMITRWRLNYGEQPSDSSWMWSYYPDGQTWKKGLEEHGADNVYDALSAKFWPTPAPSAAPSAAPLPAPSPAPAASNTTVEE